MSLPTRNRFRRIAERARAIPGSLGLRPFRVYVREGTWSGDHTGDGTETAVEVELLERGQPPKVREVSAQQVALGSVASGDYEIGPITPAHGSGGVLLSRLQQYELAQGQTLMLRIVADEAESRLFEVYRIGRDRALHYMLYARPVRRLA